MHFLAIDVETANYEMRSICQIGIVEYKDGTITPLLSSLINPHTPFNYFNTRVHGITADMVKEAPSFGEIFETLKKHMENKIVVSHTSFDKSAVTAASRYFKTSLINCSWLDSTLIAKRTWQQFSKQGYGLANLCSFLKFDFNHHDALEDAKACAYIVSKAIEQTGLCINDWLIKSKLPLSDFYKP